MKRISNRILWVFLHSLILTNLSIGQGSLELTDKEIIGWLRQHPIPIKHVVGGNGFSDLQPFKKILKDVKVLRVGETTHGTREFFQFKHRLFEFLVRELGFTVFTLEASYAGCQPINDYVLYGKGGSGNSVIKSGFCVVGYRRTICHGRLDASLQKVP
jgi:erythromycin esterase-like protein